jgi:hypothetical protein
VAQFCPHAWHVAAASLK